MGIWKDDAAYEEGNIRVVAIQLITKIGNHPTFKGRSIFYHVVLIEMKNF